jgi:hypothetical protein
MGNLGGQVIAGVEAGALVTEGIERGHTKEVITGGAVRGTGIEKGMGGGLRGGQGAQLGKTARNGELRLSSGIVRERRESKNRNRETWFVLSCMECSVVVVLVLLGNY